MEQMGCSDEPQYIAAWHRIQPQWVGASDMIPIQVAAKNWQQFQHYGNRRPPWIKLYRSLLDDYDFHCLPLASRALAPMLWLLASEQPDGTVSGKSVELAFRLRMTEWEFLAALIPLIEASFFSSSSEMLASCKQHAIALLVQRESKSQSQSTRMTPISRHEGSHPNVDIYNNIIGTAPLKTEA